MAERDEYVDSKSNENILYDLSVLAEWKVDNEPFTRFKKKSSPSLFGWLASASLRTASTILKTAGKHLPEVKPCSLSESLVNVVNTTLPWHLAVSSSGTLTAVLQENCVEIRSQRDAFESVIGRGDLPLEPYPQWRCIAWSPDETMVVCAHSSGAVFVFDIMGTQLFSISRAEGGETGAVQDVSTSVCALIFTDKKPEDLKWSAELLIIYRNGCLYSYYIDRDNGYLARHHFLFTEEYSLGISAAVYDAAHKVLFVGGASRADRKIAMYSSRQDGLTAWRALSESPHFKLLDDVHAEQNQINRKSWLNRLKTTSFFSWTSPDLDGIMQLSLSHDGSVLAGIHLSGCLSVWEVPSLRLKHQIPLHKQPDSEEINPNLAENPVKRKKMKDLIPHQKYIDVNFWSDKALILARCSGAVTVCSLQTFNNLLGISPEWFEPSPRVSQAHDGGFLGLESEVRFPKQRILNEDEDGFEDSDEEDISMMAMTTRTTKQILYYLTDSEHFQSAKKKPKTVTKMYRLVLLRSTTPEELYAQKIDAEEYGEALALAQSYGLDSDLVYQRQWRRSPVSITSIQDYLSKIHKRSWVLHECLERIPETLDAARELLQYGLHGTDLSALDAIITDTESGKFLHCDPDENLYESIDYDQFDPASKTKYEAKKRSHRDEQLSKIDFKCLTLEQKEVCRTRLKLLHYLDRLQTYECILGGERLASERYHGNFYKQFRLQNIVQLAVEYAKNSDCHALEVLFTYHHDHLVSHRLPILSHFPETTPPNEYSRLLPELGNDGVVCRWESEVWREQDWCEKEACRMAVALCDEDYGAFLYEQSPELAKYRNECPTMHLVQDWYEMKAEQIEQRSGLVDNALELIKIAIHHGFSGLKELLDDLVTMATLVYECGVTEELTLATLREMSDYTRIELMMEKSTLEMYSKNTRRWVVPVLERCEAREAGSYLRLLREFLITRARSDLAQPLKIFQTSKVGMSNPIILSSRDLIALALDVIYVSERYEQLPLAMEIFNCLPLKNQDNESAELTNLHLEVDRLERHLRAAKILQENGIPTTVALMKASENDPTAALNTVVRLTRQASKRSPPLKEVEWYKLHDNIMILQDIVYRCISPTVCQQMFVESLLCSGSLENIRLAGDMMERSKQVSVGTLSRQGLFPRLNYDMAIPLILTAAQEYFDSSASLNHECMDLARACLNLVVDSPSSVQEELDLIASLSILDDFAVFMLPLQVRLWKERLDLVKTAVYTKTGNYRQAQKLLRLAHLLNVSAKDGAERDGKVLQILAQAALQAGDISCSYQYCQQLITASYGPAWIVCLDLAEQETFRDLKAKVSLLTFAVTFASTDMLEPILQAHLLLQRQLLLEKVGHMLTHTVKDDNASGDEDPLHKDSWEGSIFSATITVKETKRILSSARHHTRTVLSSVTDTINWKKAVDAMKHPAQHKADRNTDKNRDNCLFNKQGCHPFYEDNFDICYLHNIFDYGVMEPPKIQQQDDVDLQISVLRMARLEEIFTDGEKRDAAEDAILELAQYCLPQDTALGLAYLLSLLKAETADECLSSSNSNSGFWLEIAQYYFTLQIYSALKPCVQPFCSGLYLQPPSRLARVVFHYICSLSPQDFPQDIAPLTLLFQQYYTQLHDWHQAQMLLQLAPGVNMVQFINDPQYRKETILGLAMSCEDDVYNTAVRLAERYQLPLWDIYMAHLEFLLTDSGLSVEEIRQRVNRLDMISTLKQQPVVFSNRMLTYVYPSITGSDHDRLLYLFNLVEGADQDPPVHGVRAAEHCKLIKKLRILTPDINYVKLMDEKTSPTDILAPYLTSSNINSMVKVASRIPDKKGGFLQPSSLYCGWTVRLFWEGDKTGKSQPHSAASWIHRYEACGEYIQLMLPEDFLTFIRALTCTKDSSQKLELSCRKEIVRRALKFCQQQEGKSKKESDAEVTKEWKSVGGQLLSLLTHLESLDCDLVRSFNQVDDLRFKNYALWYDLSCGDVQKLNHLLNRMILDGQPLELVEDLLQVTLASGLKVADIVHTAFHLIVSSLRGRELEGEHKLLDPLSNLEAVLKNVQEHIENGGQLTDQKQVLDLLHPYVSDADISLQQRLAVLDQLEKTVGLDEKHSALLLWCRTSQFVDSTWPQIQLEKNVIDTEDRRQELFEQLLLVTTLTSQFHSLCLLLQLWPAFTNISGKHKPWLKTLLAMANSLDSTTVALIDTVLHELGPADFPLTLQETKIVFDTLLMCQHPMEGVKILLRSVHRQLYGSAVLVLTAQEVLDEDEVLVDLVLRRELTPQLVTSSFYPQIVRTILKTREAQGLGAPPHMQLETVVGQLQEAGLHTESRILMKQAQASRPLLQSVGSALGAVGSWFKS